MHSQPYKRLFKKLKPRLTVYKTIQEKNVNEC